MRDKVIHIFGLDLCQSLDIHEVEAQAHATIGRHASVTLLVAQQYYLGLVDVILLIFAVR